MTKRPATTPPGTTPSGTTHPRPHWYRQQSPLGLRPLANGLWWTGHAQLFLAVASAAIGLLGLIAVAFQSVAEGHVSGEDWSWSAVWGLAFAPAFLLSGLALRAAASVIDAKDSAPARAASAVGMIVVIAIGAISIVTMGGLVLIITWYEASGQVG